MGLKQRTCITDSMFHIGRSGTIIQYYNIFYRYHIILYVFIYAQYNDIFSIDITIYKEIVAKVHYNFFV